MPNGKHGHWELDEIRISIPVEDNKMLLDDDNVKILYTFINIVQKKIICNRLHRLPKEAQKKAVNIDKKIREKLKSFGDIMKECSENTESGVENAR